jgi:cysteine-rich repeat protein
MKTSSQEATRFTHHPGAEDPLLRANESRATALCLFRTKFSALAATLLIGCGVCGDGKTNRDEECDDGNAEIGDGCRQDCIQEKCDDGIIDPNELCGFPEVKRVSGVQPVSLVSGDFNGDQIDDIVAVDAGLGALQFLLNDGTGTFLNSVPIAVGTNPVAIDVGDIDRDGFLDVAVANAGSGDVSVLFGLGNGSFEPALSLLAQPNVSSIAIGDADGDADLDIAAGSSTELSASLFLREGGNIFTTITLNVGIAQQDVAMVDVDGDGEKEPLFATGSTIIPTQTAFTTPIPIAASKIAVGDLDGDGVDDFIATQGFVTVALGSGDGTFSAAQSLIAGQNPGEVSLSDIDNDGLLDIATANTVSNDTSVFASDIAGGFVSEGQTTASGCLGVISITSADFNQDGVFDVALACNGSSEVRVLLTKP